MRAPLDSPYEPILSTDTVVRELTAEEFNFERLNLRNYGLETFGVFAVLAANDAHVALHALCDSALRESLRTLQSRHQKLRLRVAVDNSKDRRLFWVEGEEVSELTLDIAEVVTAREGQRLVTQRCSRESRASRPLRTWRCAGAFGMIVVRVKSGSDLFEDGDAREHYVLGALGVHSACDGVSLVHLVNDWLRVLDDQRKVSDALGKLAGPLQCSSVDTGPFSDIELPKDFVDATDAFMGAFDAWKADGAKASEVETVASLLRSGKEVESELLSSCTYTNTSASDAQSGQAQMIAAPRQLLRVQPAVASLLNMREASVSIDKDDLKYRNVDWKERAEAMSTKFKVAYLNPAQMSALHEASKQNRLSLNAVLSTALHYALRRRHLRARFNERGCVGDALDARDGTMAFNVLTAVNVRREASLCIDNAELMVAFTDFHSILPLVPLADVSAYWTFASAYDASLRDFLNTKRYLASFVANSHSESDRKEMCVGESGGDAVGFSNLGKVPARVYTSIQLEARTHWLPISVHGGCPIVVLVASTNGRLSLNMNYETPSVSDEDADLFLEDMLDILNKMNVK